MTNQEILIKAVQKAIANGWNVDLEDAIQRMQERYTYYGFYSGPSSLIFNHDFAKALWPTIASGSVDPRATSPSTARPLIPTWQAHLMEMVIADDPIKYLGENLL